METLDELGRLIYRHIGHYVWCVQPNVSLMETLDELGRLLYRHIGHSV